MYEGREFVEDGGLISYGPDIVEMTRRSATFIDKISKGADPANLPIEQPRRFELKHEAFKVYWPQPAPDFARRPDEVIQYFLPHCGKRQAGAFLLSCAG